MRSKKKSDTEGAAFGRSRRRLLAGAAGALGLLAGETIGQATPAQAGTDGDVVLGAVNTTSAQTAIDTTGSGSNPLLLLASSAIALSARNNGLLPTVSAANGAGSGGGPALSGVANSGEGAYGQSGTTSGTSPGRTRNGVHGVTDSATDSAVWGEAVSGGFGVSGSTSSSGLQGPAGVWGDNLGSGPGVLGTSQGGGAGVVGVTSGGTGVYAENVSGGGGHALRVLGAAAFSRSGLATITAPQVSATVSVPGGLSASALVFALLQTAASGVYVSAAVPAPSAGTVTIHLNKAPASGHSVKAAWFVVN